MKKLTIAASLSLSLDFVTKTAAILAQRRKGKSYLAAVIAEEMVRAKQPFVILDPTGAHWGLRSSADGRDDGLPVVVLGGQHGDVPLERTAGKLVADLVVDEPGYYVIDFSLFESGEAERQFAVDFGERLYRAKGQPGRDFPLHLFVDEADRFIPQQIRKGSQETSARLLGAFEAIVRRGGLRGIGTTLISQRAAVLNKNVLEMLDILFVLRTIGPNDREAIDGYVKAHGTGEQRAELMGSLASLEIGEGWIWEPGAEPPLFKRVRIRKRRTFNSSATPKPGEKRAEPRRLADVDLAALQKKMAATIERAKAEDPKELRRELAAARAKIAELERWQPPAPKADVKRVEVPILKDAHLSRLEAAYFALGKVDPRRFIEQLEAAGERFTKAVAEISLAIAKAKAPPAPTGSEGRRGHHPNPQVDAPRDDRRASPPSNGHDPATPLPIGERAVLTAIAQHDQGVDRAQLTILTGYRRSTRDTYIQRLREHLVDVSGDRITANAAGIHALGADFEPLPVGSALRDHWLRRLPEGERKILEILVTYYPAGTDRERISEATGYARSSRDTYIQRLGARRLVESVGRGEVRASAMLFDEGEGARA